MNSRMQREIIAGVTNLHVADKDETVVKPLKGATENTTTSSSAELAAQYIATLREQVTSLAEQNQELRRQLNEEREHSRAQAERITGLVMTLAKKIENGPE